MTNKPSENGEMNLKIGLLIIDMQKNFLEGQIEQHYIDSASEYINHVANLLRLNNHHVISKMLKGQKRLAVNC